MSRSRWGLGLVGAMISLTGGADASEGLESRVKVTEFPPASVKLLPSPYRRAQEANGEYLLRLDPHRLLNGFRTSAGLAPKGERYGGWESMGVAGHTLGHYLSACSFQFAATGDRRFQSRIRQIVVELAECQDKAPDGYIGAIPNSEKLWEELRRGEIRSKGFDLNGYWVPWYTQHKVLAGLIDAVRVGSVSEALPVAKRFGDWAEDVTRNLTKDQWQQMLACEHGGMNESLADLAELTGESRYLQLARKFHHEAVLNPLARGEDRLSGLHSNTQIPKLIGLARLFELEGKAEDRKAAEFFWDRIVNHRTFAMGGNSNHEHLSEPDRLNDHLSPQSAETCNTYNMLKLTRHLYAWEPNAKRFDFYERALTNHILGSQSAKSGMVTYFVPLQPLATRPLSTPFDSFWCCVGTGIENHARYNEAIYASRPGEVFVNLFIPSELDAKGLGIKLQLESNLPESDTVRLTVGATEGEWTLAIRRPDWVSADPKIRLNGKSLLVTSDADGYQRLRRTWSKGDTLDLQMPMEVVEEPLPDNPNRVALRYGPTVLVASHPSDIDPSGAPAPVIVPGRAGVKNWLTRLPGDALRFRSKGVLRPKDLEFIPFHEAVEGRYTTYFDKFTADQWRERERVYREEAAAKLAEERASTDVFRPGEMQPERDHAFEGERTETGEHNGRRWRHAVDGWFSFRMKVDPKASHELVCDYWSGDAGREFDILIDGKWIATQKMEASSPLGFRSVRYPIPTELTTGKTEVTVRFNAKKGSIAGGLYGARVIRPGLLKKL